MSDRPWWAHGLQWGLWAVCMSLVMGWLGRSRKRTALTTDPGRLHHPRSTLILAWVCSGFFVALFLLCAIFGGDQARIAPFFLLFAALGVPLFLDYANARHTLRPDGLEYGRMFGGGGVALWQEIRRLRYSTSSCASGRSSRWRPSCSSAPLRASASKHFALRPRARSERPPHPLVRRSSSRPGSPRA